MALLHAYQFFNGLVTSVLPTVTTAYTVPTGKRIIVRRITARNNSGSVTISAYFRVSGILLWSAALAGGGNTDTEKWIVLMPGDTIQLACNNSVGMNFNVSGSIYDI